MHKAVQKVQPWEASQLDRVGVTGNVAEAVHGEPEEGKQTRPTAIKMEAAR